ncbi:MAG: YceI family protein [Blastocatellia bacterium]|nr:YceI family protein [Blastocatellia bacterium]
MKILALIVVAFALAGVACEDPAARTSKAVTAEPISVETTNVRSEANPASGREIVALSQENSKLEFVGSKVTGRHDGGFRQFSGTIEIEDGLVEKSRVAVEIEMASVYTDADGLTEHLQTEDFFLVRDFPKALFRSTQIAPDAEKGEGHYTVTGNLTLRGTERSVTFPAMISLTGDAVAVNAEFSINRKDFGIIYAGMANDLIRDDVVIKMDLRSMRKA